MGAPILYFEVLGKDATKLQKFYSDLFDWKIDAGNPMNYGLVESQTEGSIAGGIGQAPEGQSGHVTFYAQVDDLQASLDKAEALGGKTILPPTEIPNMVTFALFQDPEGHTIGLVKS